MLTASCASPIKRRVTNASIGRSGITIQAVVVSTLKCVCALCAAYASSKTLVVIVRPVKRRIANALVQGLIVERA
jgi:hypothetical protein